MNRRTFLKTSGLVAAQTAVLASAASAGEERPQPAPSTQAPVNPFEQEGQWYKSAFHVHTTTSDGDVDVATRLGQYRKLGYAVVAVTDHWKTNDLSAFSDESFLAINGMEAHPQTGTGAPRHHLVCLDLPHPFELDREQPAQQLVDRVLAVGGRVIYAHPYWTRHTLKEMSEISGYCGMEVYNAHCEVCSGKGHNRVHWDQYLNSSRLLAAMATDDVHKSSLINGGWTMVRARSLAKADVMEAIGRGSYYASGGPTIEDLRIRDGVITIQSSLARQIRFFYDSQGAGRIYDAPDGETITTAEWNFASARRRPQWIRAEVIDPDHRTAWTSPLAVL